MPVLPLNEYRRPNGLRSMEEIVAAVSMATKVSPNAIFGRRRDRRVARARMMSMYLIYLEREELSTVDIGRFFNRDPTTVHHAKSKIRELLKAGEEDVCAVIARAGT